MPDLSAITGFQDAIAASMPDLSAITGFQDAIAASMPDLSAITGFQDAIAASMPDLSAITGFQDAIAASMPDLSAITGFQDAIAASMPDLSAITGFQDAIAASMPDLSAITGFQDAIAASMPDLLGSLLVSDSLVALAESAAVGVQAAGLMDRFASVIVDLRGAIPEFDFDDLLSSSCLPPIDETIEENSPLTGLLNSELDDLDARVDLALFVLISIPVVANYAAAVLLRLATETLFWLRLLGLAASSEPAISGLLLVLGISQAINITKRRPPAADGSARESH